MHQKWLEFFWEDVVALKRAFKNYPPVNMNINSASTQHQLEERVLEVRVFDNQFGPTWTVQEACAVSASVQHCEEMRLLICWCAEDLQVQAEGCLPGCMVQ